MKSDAIEKAALYLYKTVSKLSDFLPPLSKTLQLFFYVLPLFLVIISFPMLILILKLERNEIEACYLGKWDKGGRGQLSAFRLSHWILLTETIQHFEIPRFFYLKGA